VERGQGVRILQRHDRQARRHGQGGAEAGGHQEAERDQQARGQAHAARALAAGVMEDKLGHPALLYGSQAIAGSPRLRVDHG
jgi:hypothetical protein